MGDMPYRGMTAMMQMDDTARTGMVLFDQLEWRNTAEGNAAVWDAEGWYGGDTNQGWLPTAGGPRCRPTPNPPPHPPSDPNCFPWWRGKARAGQAFPAPAPPSPARAA